MATLTAGPVAKATGRRKSVWGKVATIAIATVLTVVYFAGVLGLGLWAGSDTSTTTPADAPETEGD